MGDPYVVARFRKEDGRITFFDGGDIYVMLDILTALARICGPQVLWPDTGEEPIVVCETGAFSNGALN